MPIKKNKKIFIYFIFLLLLGSLNNKYLNKINLPKLNEFQINGINEKNQTFLLEELDKFKINNIFEIDQAGIISIIDKIDIIENYKIFKKYPSTLKIDIEETKLLVLKNIDGKNYALGSNGKYIYFEDKQNELPYIFGNFKNEDFFRLKKIIDQSTFDYNEIKNLFFFPSGRFDIETKNGVLILLPRDGVKESLELSVELLRNDLSSKISIIDNRQSNLVIINE